MRKEGKKRVKKRGVKFTGLTKPTKLGEIIKVIRIGNIDPAN